MSTRLLEILIATAGPKLARTLARALLGYIEALVEKTPTQVDDEILAVIMRAIADDAENERPE